jgi:hypothetical protein
MGGHSPVSINADDIIAFNKLLSDNIYIYNLKKPSYEDETGDRNKSGFDKSVLDSYCSDDISLGTIVEEIADNPVFDYVGARDDKGEPNAMKALAISYVPVVAAQRALDRCDKLEQENAELARRIEALETMVLS